jgi:hypothetical protein
MDLLVAVTLWPTVAALEHVFSTVLKEPEEIDRTRWAVIPEIPVPDELSRGVIGLVRRPRGLWTVRARPEGKGQEV